MCPWHPPVQKTTKLPIFERKKKEWAIPREKGECHIQNHPDRTNLRILNFADNKDLHGGGLSESLISAPAIDGTQLEMKIKPPLPTHSSNKVFLCTRFQTPI
jgi:hypothetical protein